MNPIAKFVDCFSPLIRAEALALKRSGVDGVCRYLGAKTHPEWGKGITPEELHEITQAGLKVVFNWEGNSTSRAYFTAAQGKQDATDALTELSWLGVKPSPEIAVYFSVDYDAYTPEDFAAADAYFTEAGRVLSGHFELGAYGGLPVLEYLSSAAAKSGVQKFWQTIAWSGGRIFAHADLYQNVVSTKVDGVDVDVDQVYVAPGWYPVDPPKPAPPPEQHWNVVVGWFPSEVKAEAAAKDITLVHHWHAQVVKA